MGHSAVSRSSSHNSYDPRFRSKAEERSRATRGFVDVDRFSDPNKMRVCPPPDFILLAKKLGLYEVLWEPENLGIKFAYEAELYIKVMSSKLKSANLSRVEVHVQTYGRKSVARLVRFMEAYAEKCEDFPDAVLEVVVPKRVKDDVEWTLMKDSNA